MKVVITGASGFVGKPLSEKLANLGFDVLALVRTIPSTTSRKGISWLQVDLSSPETYQNEVKSFCPEVVIHLAWQDIPDFSSEKSKINFSQSLKFIKYITTLKSCKKILFSGSCWEYDKEIGRCEESEIVDGLKNHFTMAKNSLRLSAEKLCKQQSISFAWFRIFYVYGPGQRLGSLLPSILIQLQKGKLPKINSPYSANDYIFIDDVLEVFAIAIITNFPSGIYNIGSGAATTALEICQYAEKIALNSNDLSDKIQNESVTKVSDVNFWADITLTSKIFKWKPKTNLLEGIKLTWDSVN